MEEKIKLVNSSGTEFNIDSKTMDDILSAEFIINKSFRELDLTPDEYIAKVKEELGEPKYPSISKEGIVLGWLMYNGIMKFGIEYLERIMKEEDANKSVIYMIVALAEALTDKNKEENKDLITSDSKIGEEE